MALIDEDRFDRAFELAERAVGVSEPNPRVGCVIGSADGQVFGEGSTQSAGQAHAEVMALADARERGIDPRGATAWVTLEPCSHFGRTPPCCNALIEAGIARVVVASLDPNPAVNGRGMQRLREAGLQVELADERQAIRSRELNIGFFSRMSRGRSWVRLKIACSLDGRVALPDGSSRWITGPEARTDGHRWRKRAGAILTGVGTVLADDPRLDVRLVPTQVQPLRVVLDSHGRVPASAAILQPPGRVLLVTALPSSHAKDQATPSLPTIDMLRVQRLQTGLDLHGILAELADRQVNELHVEAGPRLNAAFIEAGLVDELLLYQAPLIVGPGLPMADLSPRPSLSAATRVRVLSRTDVGDDVRVLARPETTDLRT